MQSLPVEICQDIFLSTLSYESFSTRSLLACEHAVNFQIAATCVRWREIALQTPGLWARIKIHGLCGDWIIQYVSLQLERSGISSLELRFSFDKIEHAGPSDAEAYSKCLQLAGKHIGRWKRVHIELPQWTTADELAMLTMPSPLLEELVILPVPEYATYINYRSASVINDHAIRPVNFQPESSIRYFADAHQLVRLESHATPMVPAHLLERLAFLSISFRNISDTPLWSTLAMTPNLQELRVYYPLHSSSRTNDPLSAGINLPYLTHLSLFGLPGSFSWLEFFDAPKLHTLAVGVEQCPRLGPLFVKLRDTVRHIIITTVDSSSDSGFLNVTDAVALDLFSTIDTFEIRDLTQSMLQNRNEYVVSSHDEFPADSAQSSFFQHFVHRVRGGEGWIAQFRLFVVNGCTFHLDACNSLFDFIRAKDELAGEGEGFVCEVIGGTALVGTIDVGLDTVPQAFRDTVKIDSQL